MSSLNKVQIIGHLGQDVKLSHTQTGKPVANFTVATSFPSKEGAQAQTEWHKVQVWDKLAENCAQYLSKGKLCYVEGRLATRMWEKDGHKNYTTEIIAQNIQFLSPRDENRMLQQQPLPHFGSQSLANPGQPLNALAVDHNYDPNDIPF